ncbi:bifunctional metallophosphatase/5'-nucleotidase [Bacillus sp. UMB0728]|uniref:bifunctional metallophosphatase/5'-nucleotidase n=1 Tax=Bacillus sp. UMB0728 TaxID=2066052 RepID=UPI000C7620B0|nr:bifunctional UDP-sugar hydrolase/5'-nucleotidase [Bacillus sp. UMB0728]PLR71561.1 bifunctional metallophosphatase/5'-nucleotidase [Bacillus sp. UMB0728]
MKNKEIVSFLITSDLHGSIYPYDYSTGKEQAAGLAKLASVIRQEKAKADHTLLLDNGDLIQGTPLMYHYSRFLKHRVNPMVQVLNKLEYDAAVIGNHEFNYGIEMIKSAASESNFPWLSANVLHRTTKEPYFGVPYMIKEMNELKIAVLGITTSHIPNWERPDYIQELFFDSAIETLARWIPYVEETEKPDFLAVAYHGGFERDRETGAKAEEETGENEAYRICMEFPEIDLLITGHQHRRLSGKEVNGVPVIMPGAHGSHLGKVEVTFEKVRHEWTIAGLDSSLISNEGECDKEIIHDASFYENETQKWLDEEIGSLTESMLITDPLEARIREHPLIELVNRVQMDASGAKISCTALFNEGAPGFSSTVTMRDIMTNYIYPNTLAVLQITGQDIKDALERSASYFRVGEDGEIAVNPSFSKPKPQHYNYDMWEGIEYELNLSQPEGSRVTVLEHRGEAMKMDEVFEVVMNHYRAGGGGGYWMFKNKPVIREIHKDMTELLAEYIRREQPVKAEVNANWKVTANSHLLQPKN